MNGNVTLKTWLETARTGTLQKVHTTPAKNKKKTTIIDRPHMTSTLKK